MGIGAMHKHLGVHCPRLRHDTHYSLHHYTDELLSEVLTRRTGEGVGAAAVAAGAAERQRTRATEGRSSGRCSVWASLCGQGWESAPCTRLGAQRARIATLLSGDVPGKERGGRRG